jgi:hypothetical protein
MNRLKKYFRILIISKIIIYSSAFATAPVCSGLEEKSNSNRIFQRFSVFKDLDDSFKDLGPNEIYLHKLYSRLTGSAISSEGSQFKRLLKLVNAHRYDEVAEMITNDRKFLQIRVRNFAAPFSGQSYSTTEPFNDLQALIIGIVRDGLDARLLLTGNFRYEGRSGLGLPASSLANNDHYLAFDNAMLSYDQDLERVDTVFPEINTPAGALTTRAWAKMSYDAGTNRRSVRNAVEGFLCVPIDSWKMRGVPDIFIRRDVERAPAGNPATFQNTCRSCHAIMDGMGGAFAKVDFVDSKLVTSKTSIFEKMNRNSHVYPEGFVTVDDSWTNLLFLNTSFDFGWRSEIKGQGIQEFGNMLAQSLGYSRCLVRKVFSEVCGSSVTDHGSPFFPKLVEQFEASNRNLKKLFAQIAVTEECLARPKDN